MVSWAMVLPRVVWSPCVSFSNSAVLQGVMTRQTGPACGRRRLDFHRLHARRHLAGASTKRPQRSESIEVISERICAHTISGRSHRTVNVTAPRSTAELGLRYRYTLPFDSLVPCRHLTTPMQRDVGSWQPWVRDNS